MKRLALCSTAALALAGGAWGQTDPYVIFSDVPDDAFIVQGGAVANTWAHEENDLAIAVGDTIRALDWSQSTNGSEYDFSGGILQSDVYAPIAGFVGQALDGASDGVSSNFAVEWSGGGNVWQTDRDWANGVAIFNTNLSMIGVTCDSSNGTLWVSEDNTGIIVNYALDGTRLGSFSAGDGRWGCLAYEESTDTLWMVENGTSEMRQYRKDGTLLTSQFGNGEFGNVWGGEFPKGGDPCNNCPCPEDINRDGVVDFADILRILAAWGPCDDNACDFPGVCGQFERCGVGEPFDCFCWTLFDGSGACYQDFPCGDVEDCPDGNCPPGFVCVVRSCCEVNKCVPMIKCDERAYPLFEGATGLTGSGSMIEPSTPDFGAMMELGPQRRGDVELPAGPHDIVGTPRVDRTIETNDVSNPAAEELTRTFGHTGRSAPDFGDTTLIDPDVRIMTVQIGLDGFTGSENVITFDELGGVVPDPGPFSIGDVTFSEMSSGSGGPGWRLLDFDFPGPPLPQILTDNAGISDIRIDFATPQDRAGVFVGIGPATYVLEAYDQSGNLLETAQVTVVDVEEGAFLGFENLAGISRLRVIEPTGDNGRVGGIDDVHYERLPRDEKWCNGPYDCEVDTCWFSTRNSAVNPFIRYDDFVCPEESLVGKFEFIAGGWLDGPCDLLSNLAAVEISIYEWRPDEVCGWAPGRLICTNVVPVGDMDIERFCVDQFGIRQYQFRGLLPEPCLLAPGPYAILIAGVVADPNGCFMCWAATSQPRRCLGYSVDQNIGEGCTSPQDMVFCIDTVDPCDDCPCPEDINRDGVVDFADILRVLAAWGPCEEECDDCEDGFVDRCGGTDDCLECQTPDGRCICTFGALIGCGEFRLCDDGECPPGFFCCLNTCCAEPICMALCEADAPEFERAEPGELTPTGVMPWYPTFDRDTHEGPAAGQLP